MTSFVAEPESIVEGEAAVLRWTTSKAKTIYLLENGIRVDEGGLPVKGELEVRPTRDTTYRLEARDAKGLSVHKELTVSVQPFGPPQIASFEASATTVQLGQPVVLSWKVNRATSIRIAEGSGSLLATTTEAEGSFEVRPNRPTTYVLSASNRHGEVSAQVEVTIGTAPFVVLRFDESEVDFEAEATLSWEVGEAETIVVTDPTGATLHEGEAVDGSVTFAARHSGAYRATARGPGGESAHLAFLDVRPVIDEFEVAAPGRLAPGEPATATWAVRGAETIHLFTGAKWVDLDGSSGSLDVVIPDGGVFVLRAIRGPITVEKDVALFVGERPVIRQLRAGPLVTAGKGQRGVATVEWEVEGAAKLILVVEPDGRIVDITTKSPRMDSVDVEFTQPGIVRLVATNGAGETIEEIPAPVDPVPDIDAFFAAPSRAGSGEAVQIHWETTNAARVILEQDGVEVQSVDPADVDGFVTVGPIFADSTFVLRTFNTLDFEYVSAPLVVPVGAPNILSLGTEDGRTMYPVDTRVRLVWENDGGTSLTVTDVETGAVVCSTADVVDIRKGGCDVDLPSEQKTLRYRVEVTNGSGSDAEILELMAVTGPIILEFTTDVDEITVGGSVLFSWDVTLDASGNIPVLHLEDDLGNVYPVEDADPLQGSKRFNVTNAGDRIFTLTATATNPPPYQLPTTVKVWDIPVIDHLAATPAFAENEGDPVEVEWATSRDAALVELYLVDRATGEPEPTPVHSAPTPVGSATVHPTIAKPHVLLVVSNPLGARTSSLLPIDVNPARITMLDVSAYDVMHGEEVTIEWTTAGATKARWSESMLDLSVRPTAIATGIHGDESNATVVFPNGFTFPYDGGQFKGLSVSSNGWISFSMGQGSNCCNTSLPSTGNNLDMAVFWDDLVADATKGRTVYWEYFEEPIPHVIVHWGGVEFFSSSKNPSSLSFQAILFASGRFEYRYGAMTSTPQLYAEGGNSGDGATIGTQNRARSQARVLLHDAQFPDGLSGMNFAFGGWNDLLEESTPRPAPVSGTWTFQPQLTRTYTLRAWNGHSAIEEAFEIRVHPWAKLRVWAEPDFPEPGEPVTMHWEGRHLTSLVIEDGAGNVLYTVPEAELESGSWVLGPLPKGEHSFKFRGVGRTPRDSLEKDLEVRVDDAFSLDSFTASASRIELTSPPTPVTLSWATTNATTVTLRDSTGTTYPISPAEYGSGSLDVSPSANTTYTLVVENRGRIRTAEVRIEVQTTWVDLFEATATTLLPGQSTQLSWETRGGGSITVTGVSSPGASGTVTVTPSKRTEYTICIDDGNWKDCRTIEVVVLEPGDLVFTELMIAPGAGSPQWFEVANLTGGALDLEGFEIRMGTQTHTIQTGGPLILEKGQVMVFAQSQANGLDPDYVYGPAMQMTAPSGAVGLYWDGTKIAETSWSNWTIPAGASLEMKTDTLTNGTVSWTSANAYVATTEAYDGTNKGTPGTWGVLDTASYIVHFLSSDRFIDIRDTGIDMPAMTADSGRSGFSLASFSMPFFGTPIDRIWVDTNGWMSFAATQPGVDHFAPDNPPPRGTAETPLAPLFSVFWDDWGCAQSPDPAFFHFDRRTIGGQAVLVFQWTNIKRCGHTGGVTFQAQLWENGDLVVAVDDMWFSGSAAENTYRGDKAWIAIEPAGNPAGHLTTLYKKPLAFPGRSYLFQHK